MSAKPIRINKSHWQPGPLAIGAVGLYGVYTALDDMSHVETDSGGWWIGVAVVILATAGVTAVLLLWLWGQREVGLDSDRILVRRWLEVTLRRPGVSVPIDAGTRVAVVKDGSRRLRIERDGERVVDMQVWYWSKGSLELLIEAMRDRGIEVDAPEPTKK
jgi:hypothetical protein